MRGQTCIEGCIEQLSRLFMFWFFLEKHKYTTVRRLETDYRRTRKRHQVGGSLIFYGLFSQNESDKIS
jgi:trans-2-enoyl-CoA reductase